METKYNYVFYNISEDYLKPAFMPLKKYPFVRVYEHSFCASKLVQKIFFLWWSKKINDVIKLPFKKLWFEKICKQDFNDNKPICYVFLGGKYLTDCPDLYRYIKKMNSNNRCIIYCWDKISKKRWKVEDVRKYTDFIVSYDPLEAEKYDIECSIDVCYEPTEDICRRRTFEYEVYFLGFAKDRLDQIHGVYKYLVKNNVKCKFIICGADPEKRIEGEGLYYSDPISYKENIANINNSKCVLEIVQGGTMSPTIRVAESQAYRRKLITNYERFLEHPVFDNKTGMVFKEPEDINIDFIRSDIDYSAFHSEFFNTSKRIAYLENLLLEEKTDG